MGKTNDVLKFAKQGNPKAIEAIFSKQLKAQDIAVKAVVRDGCLQIMFEAKQALSQVTMVNGVKKVLTGIKPENIQTVKVYSKQSGDDFPKWHEEFELAEKKKGDVSPNIDLVQPEAPKLSETIIPTSDSNESPSQAKNSATESSQLIDTNAKSHVNDLTNNLTSPNIADEDSLLTEKAKWGDLGSISILLNAAFNNLGVSVSLDKPTAKFLEIILKSNDIIDKQVAIEIICRILNKTKTRVFNEVSVSVDTSENDFPSWNQDLIFQDNQFIEKGTHKTSHTNQDNTKTDANQATITFEINQLMKKPFSGVIVACTLLGLIGVGWSIYQRNVYESRMSTTNTQTVEPVRNSYPLSAIINYTDVCEKGGSTRESCSCFINKAQDVFTLDELVKINKEVSNGGKNPEKVETILAQCKEEQISKAQSQAQEKTEKFLTQYLEDIIKGGSNSNYYCEYNNQVFLFSPRSYKILSVFPPAITPNSVDISRVRIESSNRGGMQITKDWSFTLKNSGVGEYKLCILSIM
jgi:hypothetical protein